MKMVNIVKLTKKFALASVLAAVLLSAPFASAASAEIRAQDYVASVTLFGMEHIGRGSWTLYLGIPESGEPAAEEPKTAASEAGTPEAGEESKVDFIVDTQSNCPFFNSRGNRVTPEEFMAENDRKIISIEFMEYEHTPGNYVIITCRSLGERSGRHERNERNRRR